MVRADVSTAQTGASISVIATSSFKLFASIHTDASVRSGRVETGRTILTTVSTDLNDLAAKAVNLLLKRIDEDGTDFKPEKLTADFRLVRRESTGR